MHTVTGYIWTSDFGNQTPEMSPSYSDFKIWKQCAIVDSFKFNQLTGLWTLIIGRCWTRKSLSHWIPTRLNLLINSALINLVTKIPKRNHCHTLHEENVGLPHSVQAARISSTNMNFRKRK